MSYIGTFDGEIFYNAASRYCVISVKTADQGIPEKARESRRYKDHLIRFVAVGYELPRTDALEVELEGEWVDGKHGCQLQVEQWREIVPKTKDGVEAYLGSGLIKGIGPKLAAEIVARFGVEALDILERHPERLTEIKGITENKLEDIKASYAQSRMLQDIMTLLAPFKVTPKTALKIYQHFGASSMEILKKSAFELCQISGFGFLRVDAIVQKTNPVFNDPMRIKGAVICSLNEAKSRQGHLFLEKEELVKASLKLLNKKIPLPEHRLRKDEVETVIQNLILNGSVVSMRDNIYTPGTFSQEDEAARLIAKKLIEQPGHESIDLALEQVKEQFHISLSEKQEQAVQMVFQHNLCIITGSPGTGKTTVLKTLIEVYRRLHSDGKLLLMAPTGRASRRMAESTGVEGAKTLHSGLGLTSEEDESNRGRKDENLPADLVIVDEFSMADMWLAGKLFQRVKAGARLVLVGDADQLPSVGAGNVFHEMIQCGIVPTVVLDQIFRQAKDSLIAHNAKFINQGKTSLYYGNDFIFIPGSSQEEVAETLIEFYCQEIAVNGIENVQILSPFRGEGEASADQLNTAIREMVNPFQSMEDEIQMGTRNFRIGDRVMQTKNTDKVSNGDLGFIRYIKDTPEGKRIGMDFGTDRQLEYGMEDMGNLDLAYATTVHKAMGGEYNTVLMPIIKAHSILLYRNLVYTGITRAKKRIILIGEKGILFMAIHKNEINKRNTLLGERIRMYFRAFAVSAGIPLSISQKEKLKNAG